MADGFAPSDRHGRVIDALENRSPKLAGMYRSALATLTAPCEPGNEVARVAIICHCMRELMNGLPNVMTEGVTPRPKPSSESLKMKLPTLLAQHPELDLTLDQDLIPVPRPVAQVLSDLISTVTQEQGRNRRNAAELVTDGSDESHPAIQQWMEAQRFFLGRTHLDRNHDKDRDLPSDATMMTQMRIGGI